MCALCLGAAGDQYTRYMAAILLLVHYAVSVFLVAEMYHQVTYHLGIHPSRDIPPKSLPIRSLKELLEQRGVSYDKVFEKTELEQLVQASGRATEEEIGSLQVTPTTKVDETRLTTGYQYSRQVESCDDGCHDGALLVMVAMELKDKRSTFFPLNQESWKKLGKRVGKFGIRTGIMNCALDLDLSKWCKQRKWQSPRFVLSLPEYGREKPRVLKYFGPFIQESVYKWVLDMLCENVPEITTTHQLQTDWLTFRSPLRLPENDVVLVTDQPKPAPFICALSAHFTDSAKFAWLNIKKIGPKDPWELLNIDPKRQFPVVLVANNEGTYVYGNKSAECFTYSCLRLFLSHFRPHQSAAVTVSIVTAILLALLEFLVSDRSDAMMRNILIKGCFNLLLTLFCWSLLSFDNIFFVKMLNSSVLKATRFFATTSFGATLRKDVLLLSEDIFVLLAVGLLAVPTSSILAVTSAMLICFVKKSLKSLIRTVINAVLQRTRANAILDQTQGTRHKVEDLSKWQFIRNCTQPESDFECEECAICKQQFIEREWLAALPCAHTFHYDCLATWLTTSERGDCPMCRQ
ncbi:E3 ubiquitin-protein ligase RNF103-like [Littorina saxatilis]|uniref:E3 ubiquitin-protein ligase RNF103-like n=1 Tax=Littorina saxatilis TaxID=31220 RepID=UPI0038B5081A